MPSRTKGGDRLEPNPAGALTFLDPRGQPVIAVPPRPRPPNPGWPAILAVTPRSASRSRWRPTTSKGAGGASITTT